MSNAGDSPRLAIKWSAKAKSEVRAIGRQTALDILHCIDRYLAYRMGDVKQLRPPLSDFRLRCGDYRVFFQYLETDAIEVIEVWHRRDAYRGRS